MKIKTLKTMAKSSLIGSYKPLILGELLMYFSLSIISMPFNYLLDSSDFSYLVSSIVSFFTALLTGIFQGGLFYMILRTIRKQEIRPLDVLIFFKKHPDRFIIASLIFTTPRLISDFVDYFYPVKITTASYFTDISTYFLINLLISIFFNLIIYSFFGLVYIILVEEPDLSPIKALKKSYSITRKYRFKIILLLLSFSGFYIISAFTFFLGLLWVYIYQFTTLTYLYLMIEKKA